MTRIAINLQGQVYTRLALVLCSSLAFSAIVFAQDHGNRESKLTGSYHEPLAVPNVATISNGPDNGALDCNACSNWEDSGRHGTTKKAVTNLIHMLDGKIAVSSRPQPWICGHGSEGFLTTGAGQDGEQNADNVIIGFYESHWGPELDRLQDSNYTQLSIVSCHTGAGEDGAQLLYAMAERSGKAVRARTGFAYCGSCNITYESGSTWQVAVPGEGPPDPIDPPTHHYLDVAPREIHLLNADEDKVDKIDLSEVTEVRYVPGHFFSRRRAAFTLEGDEARGLLKMVGWSHPIQPGGKPLAVETGRLTINYTFKGDKKRREFIIYNDRLIGDTLIQQYYYYARPGFKVALEMAKP